VPFWAEVPVDWNFAPERHVPSVWSAAHLVLLRVRLSIGKATHLIHDRDPPFSPNCNPHAERFVRTIRTEGLDQFVIFGERHLRYLVETFIDHYLTGRYHRGLGGRLINPSASPSNDNVMAEPIQCRSRLGGLLNYYHREAA
jgi:hypothetical protein